MHRPGCRGGRSGFEPSERLARPYVILGANVVAAETDAEARLLATSGRESFASLRRGMPIKLPPPNPAFEAEVFTFGDLPPQEMPAVAMVGSPATVLDGFERFLALTSADELMVTSYIYDHGARVRSLEIVAGLQARLAHE